MDELLDVLVSENEFDNEDERGVTNSLKAPIRDQVPEQEIDTFTSALARALLTALSFLMTTLDQQRLPDQKFLVYRISNAVIKEVTDQLMYWDRVHSSNQVSTENPVENENRESVCAETTTAARPLRRPRQYRSIHRTGTILIPHGKPYSRNAPH